jgi:hypothetical protein
MPKSIVHLIRPTPHGVCIDLRRLNVYPDGHGNLILGASKKEGGENWPFNDALEGIEIIASGLVRPMMQAAIAQEKARRKVPPADMLDQLEVMRDATRKKPGGQPES